MCLVIHTYIICLEVSSKNVCLNQVLYVYDHAETITMFPLVTYRSVYFEKVNDRVEADKKVEIDCCNRANNC